MPGLLAIIRHVSLNATTALVAAGYAAPFVLGASPSLSVTNVTNATPMVVTVAGDVGVRPGLPLHVVISGVLGCTAANHLDTATDSATANRNRAWHAVVLTSSTFALYELSLDAGALVAVAGNGAYTGGGTVSKAFTEGRILETSDYLRDPSYPPRVVMFPTESAWGPKNVASASRTNGSSATELRREVAQRSIGTDQVHFQVHAWGIDTLPLGLDDAAIESWQQTRDPAVDLDAAQVLYQQIVRSVHALAAGIYTPQAVRWTDASEGRTQKLKAGHEVVFTMAVDTPVLGILRPRAPADVSAVTVTTLQLPDGSTEVGCSQG